MATTTGKWDARWVSDKREKGRRVFDGVFFRGRNTKGLPAKSSLMTFHTIPSVCLEVLLPVVSRMLVLRPWMWRNVTCRSVWLWAKKSIKKTINNADLVFLNVFFFEDYAWWLSALTFTLWRFPGWRGCVRSAPWYNVWGFGILYK